MPEIPEHDWLYYRIHVGDTDHADRLLLELVRPAVREAKESIPELRWFFLRFWDATGMHVRLRLFARRSQLARVERRLDHELDSAMRCSLCSAYDKFLYEPEMRKFGSGPGIRLAETLFQESSETALNCLGPRLRTMRAGYGAAHMLLLLDILPEHQRTAFLHQYSWYWSGGPLGRTSVARRPPSVPPARAQAQASRIVEQAERVLSDDATRQTLCGYHARFQAAVRSGCRPRETRTDYFQLFHHIHLTNNRLAIFSGAEAAIARLLWTARRADTGIEWTRTEPAASPTAGPDRTPDEPQRTAGQGVAG